jgi:hypothetical protein
LTSSTFAEGNCPQGSTCKCEPTKFTKCTVDAKGNQKCTESVGEKCTVVSGPGSGKAAVAGQGTVTRADKNKVNRPKNAAPATSNTK